MNLFIDTSNNNLILILEKDNNVIDSFVEKNQTRLSDIVLIEINKLLKKHDLTLRNIEKFYITKGPGSYTGVRLAITIVKTLKTVNNSFRVYAISSLAYQAGSSDCVSLLDAKGQKSYVGVYQNKRNIIVDQLLPDEYICDFCKNYKDFALIKDYYEIDFVKNYLDLKEKFELIEDIDNLEPVYIKNFI
ncbi:tRNA (adenosine(37)-N6)-threonylcarbamoyltransferase complex dimerization subunit type 1 TsaB [Spiroplasma tabanidicola]|uniref:tRNA threonylcarbamoyladenosine biosynthesis protein TsaB n=1 Tax=Spiroplasma tabanidicola TaxID=324079 RepID=A0A6I6CC00_9MOLU|nr:tRNA (adenosine(37)-N6)-threonylcarbamoyltransferase complex dimerization subunit type 1 TsaB [Spiroplasma tabanidicola]QGS51622.1 tRNA threonylcarbamoyladenosine biosynthesis protein TsaB [Spiroplasma tabanidicola]